MRKIRSGKIFSLERIKEIFQASSMDTAAQKMGRKAESFAARYFRRKGFVIVARNYRYQRAEVDIIVRKRRLLVFVEVKARSSDRFGDPETFVSPKQKALLHTAAAHYVSARAWSHAIRFDIVAIRVRNNQLQLTHFEDAFY